MEELENMMDFLGALFVFALVIITMPLWIIPFGIYKLIKVLNQ